MAAEWQRLYQGWAGCQFRQTDSDKMEQEAQAQLKQLVKVAREVKDRDWPVIETSVQAKKKKKRKEKGKKGKRKKKKKKR